MALIAFVLVAVLLGVLLYQRSERRVRAAAEQRRQLRELKTWPRGRPRR